MVERQDDDVTQEQRAAVEAVVRLVRSRVEPEDLPTLLLALDSLIETGRTPTGARGAVAEDPEVADAATFTPTLTHLRQGASRPRSMPTADVLLALKGSAG